MLRRADYSWMADDEDSSDRVELDLSARNVRRACVADHANHSICLQPETNFAR
jgi:hypothetical protein